MAIILFPIVQFFVGVYQIISTLVLYARYNKLSEKSQMTLKVYSIVSVIYLASLAVIENDHFETWYMAYLFVLPWFIAIWRFIFGREAYRESREEKTTTDSEDLIDVNLGDSL